ncbi:glycosyl hydrolase 2 galactose-binding domain-containing protein [Aeoliella sp. SH292]|uniref:glycosyl hydrolase 2 galactose-binding domain-containing protein n=1 Tax=Aeoliella sp. SH292 TaxID=3454464 RepID=UPI003F9B631A
MHFIRLRGPWRLEVLEQLAGAPTVREGKQQMPADWSGLLGDDFRGTVRYRRVFHEPTGLEPGQQVWLSIEGLATSATISLNGTPLPPHAGHEEWRHEIRELLLPNSELIIDVTHPATAEGPGGLTGLVQLEIQTVRPRPVD